MEDRASVFFARDPFVGMAKLCPKCPNPWPDFAPYFTYAIFAAPFPCIPDVLEPKTKISFSARHVMTLSDGDAKDMFKGVV